MSDARTTLEGEIATVLIEKAVPGGRGLSKFEGRPVFVEGGVPGDRVEIRIVRDRGTYFEAAPVQVIDRGEASREDAAVCPHALERECGGCDWARVRPAAEPQLKTQILTDALRRVGKLDPASLPPVAFIDSALFYRLRTRLHLDGLGRLGFFAPDSHDVCDLASCEVLAPSLLGRLKDIRRRLSGSGTLPSAEIHLLENADGSESGVSVVLPPGADPDSVAQALAGAAGSIEVSGGGGKQTFLDGPPRIPIRAGGAEFLVSARSFFQVNRFLLGDFLRTVRDPISEARGRLRLETGFDLYAGCGFLTRALAETLPRTFAVEPDGLSGADLRVNAKDWERELGTSLRTVNGTAESFLGKTRERPDVVVLDPPRAGISPEVRTSLLRVKPRLLIYVSCDPATLARDLKDLVRDYSIQSLTVLNLFPATHHLETVAILERASLAPASRKRD